MSGYPVISQEPMNILTQNALNQPFSPHQLLFGHNSNNMNGVRLPVLTNSNEAFQSGLHFEGTGVPSANPSNLSMTTSITSALCANSSIAGPHLLPACSPLLQLAIRQALSACLPSFSQLSIQGALEVSVGSDQAGENKACSSTVLHFADNTIEKNDSNTNYPSCNISEAMPLNMLQQTPSQMTTSTGVGSAKRKASNPTKYSVGEYLNEFMTQSISPTPSTSSADVRTNSAPTSPSVDSGVLDLSRNGSLAGSAPMTPMKESTPLPVGSIRLLNSQHLLQMYQNQLATLGQLQSLWAGNSFKAANGDGASPSQINSLNLNLTMTPTFTGQVSTPKQPKRQRMMNRSSSDATRVVSARRLSTNRRFPCNQCGEEFPSLQTLEEHTMRLHGSYRCHICEAQFTQRSNLQRHALKHVGFKPFECRVCTKSYYRKDHLMRHMEMGHPGFSPREYITVHLTSSESLEFLNRAGLGQVRAKEEDVKPNPPLKLDQSIPDASMADEQAITEQLQQSSLNASTPEETPDSEMISTEEHKEVLPMESICDTEMPVEANKIECSSPERTVHESS